MKKFNRKFITSIFIFFIILLLTISIIMANNLFSENDVEVDKEKIYYEIKYFDSEIIYMMNLVNTETNEIDWDYLQKQTTILYNYWNSAVLDINCLDIEKTEITSFGNYLDQLLIAIRYKNKNYTIANLAKLYSKLIMYVDKISYNNYKTLLLAKYNLLLAYSILDTGNWTLIHEHILQSSTHMYAFMNLNDMDEYQQYNINQAYVAIREMENLINIKNRAVFNTKYQISLDKLGNL